MPRKGEHYFYGAVAGTVAYLGVKWLCKEPVTLEGLFASGVGGALIGDAADRDAARMGCP